FQARGQPLDVPFPRAWQRLIEIVDVEDQTSLGRTEDAEVGQVRVAAGLHGQPGYRRGGQVAGHRQRRPPVVGEGGHHHPPVPTRTSSGTRDLPCSSSRAIGSGRSGGGSNTAWLLRG